MPAQAGAANMGICNAMMIASGNVDVPLLFVGSSDPGDGGVSTMQPMKIRITAGGQVFTAETHPDAPLTVAAFVKLLPYRQKLIHVRWSGEGCWVPLGDWVLENDGKAVGFENATSHPAPGDILFYPGGYSETEIIMAYGACCFASKLGQLAGNHFLTIVEGRERLRELGVKVLWEGAQDVLFEAV